MNRSAECELIGSSPRHRAALRPVGVVARANCRDFSSPAVCSETKVVTFPGRTRSAAPPAKPALSEESIRTAFFTAILLTRSVILAEAAVVAELENPGRAGTLEEAVASRAIRTQPDDSFLSAAAAEDARSARALLPPGLHSVFELSTRLRHAYVLRILMNLPREVCARVLNTTVPRLDDHAIMAAALLA